VYMRVGPSLFIIDHKSPVGVVLCISSQQAIQAERLPDRKSLVQQRLPVAKRRP
jgi:hypothetical protein